MEQFESYFDLLKQLIRTPSVVGAENPYFMTLKRELEDLGIKTTLYEGLLVAQGNNPDSGYISSHTDRHGLICTGPNEFQYAAYISKNRGDLTGNSISEQTYKNMNERFKDQKVQAYSPCSGNYLGMGTIKTTYICERRGNLIFEIEGLEYLIPNTPVAFLDKLTLKDNFVIAQLDNVITNAMIIYLYQLGYQGTAFFTAEEEAGKSWRYLLEWFQRFDISTDKLLILDTSPYSDISMIEKLDVVFRRRDSHARFKSPLQKQLIKFCRKNKISYDYKDRYIKERNKQMIADGNKPSSIGSTELGRLIVASKNKIQGTTLQVPTTGYHTVEETAKIDSIIKALRALKNLYLS
ncbi:MAG: peptidase M42 [Sulfurovaceae bacterium]|nr:peptidase M42 [Sulfurovaceae bacterium]MDD5360362.1 peptidase M42 [Sulfurovaceae bacterium]MDD5548917.1 peptidase M42 [Sulfurovaceae bacterium]